MRTNCNPPTGETLCPFYAPPTQTCFAVSAGASPGKPQWAARCETIDYDDCPSFLGRTLRSLKAHPFLVQRDFGSK